MTRVVVDTDVASAILTQTVPSHIRRQLAGSSPAITFVTAGELAKGATLKHWGWRRRAALAAWQLHAQVLPYDEDVAAHWGQLQARAQLRGRPRPVNDTWIAACCLAEGLPLATLNIKDFEDFARYEGLRLLVSAA